MLMIIYVIYKSRVLSCFFFLMRESKNNHLFWIDWLIGQKLPEKMSQHPYRPQPVRYSFFKNHVHQTNQFYNRLALKIMHTNNFTDFDTDYNGVQMILNGTDG